MRKMAGNYSPASCTEASEYSASVDGVIEADNSNRGNSLHARRIHIINLNSLKPSIKSTETISEAERTEKLHKTAVKDIPAIDTDSSQRSVENPKLAKKGDIKTGSGTIAKGITLLVKAALTSARGSTNANLVSGPMIDDVAGVMECVRKFDERLADVNVGECGEDEGLLQQDLMMLRGRRKADLDVIQLEKPEMVHYSRSFSNLAS